MEDLNQGPPDFISHALEQTAMPPLQNALWYNYTDQALKNILGKTSSCAPSKLQAGRTTR